MTPYILFLNGPECQAKLQLLQSLKSKFSDDVCIYVNRKETLKMFNAHNDSLEESFEWVLQKMLKSIINNGVFIIFDVFLPTRRMNQYALQLKGLPCYWLGVFIKDISDDFSKEFYDYSVVIDPEAEDFSSVALEVFLYASKNAPCCFTANKIVEKKARKRLIPSKEDRLDDGDRPEKADQDRSFSRESRGFRKESGRSFKPRRDFGDRSGSDRGNGRRSRHPSDGKESRFRQKRDGEGAENNSRSEFRRRESDSRPFDKRNSFSNKLGSSRRSRDAGESADFRASRRGSFEKRGDSFKGPKKQFRGSKGAFPKRDFVSREGRRSRPKE